MIWARGLVAHRIGRIVLTGAGIALASALVAVIGIFATSSAQTMTHRAIESVPIDWRIALGANLTSSEARSILASTAPGSKIATVGYADVNGFGATTGGTIQATGPGQVLGLSEDYGAIFPRQIRPLLGSDHGVLLAQQTAANLHAAVGDEVRVTKADGSLAAVKVDGIVDLPNADAMFQPVGPKAATAVTAPPDNVLLMPLDHWRELFDPKGAASGAHVELHVGLGDGGLPADPDSAYAFVVRAAHKVEARGAGTMTVDNIVGARLDGVRGDALYAGVLFLFLGLPGAVLGILLTVAMVSSGADRRRHEQALLRLRGASARQAIGVLAVEVGFVGSAGTLGGAGIALAVSLRLGVDPLRPAALGWLTASAAGGAIIACLAVLAPALSDLAVRPVTTNRRSALSGSTPMWRRIYLDIFLLAGSAAIFWRTAASGYQVVLAPEGVAAAAVDYQAFLAPLLLWLGGGLLALRLARIALSQRRSLARLFGPLAGGLSETVASTTVTGRGRIAAGIVMVGLAVAFAVSTSLFNATYEAQLLVDAQLTNGADVTVSGTAQSPASARLAAIRAMPEVADAEPMQHRFAYVGNDLQDLYGIDPAGLGRATSLSDGYFADRNATVTLDRLAKVPDGVLVSQETVNDFQLAIGDLINLRLQSATDHHYHVVPFHLVGVVAEFPTAPKDSFLVANAAYVAAQTGSTGAELVLVKARGATATAAAAIRSSLGPTSSFKVTEIGATAAIVASSLTAIDLHGLARVELGFAILLVAASAGLTLALGFRERRGVTTILWALGASRRKAGLFLLAEGWLVLCGGVLVGVPLGAGIATMLVRLLGGVFDPPPDAMTVPWVYLVMLLATATVAALTAIGWETTRSRARRDLGAGLLS